MTDYPTYLERRDARVALLDLKRQIVFGYGLGVVMIFVGGVKWLLRVEAGWSFWNSLMLAGALALLLTLVFPAVWILPERGFHRVTVTTARGLLLLLLSIFYYLLICPVGWWIRHSQRNSPPWEWTDHPLNIDGWQPKTVSTITHRGKARDRRIFPLQAFSVIGFFIKHRNYLLLPIVMLLIILGLIMFFVQTSALAPLIYPLF